MLIGRAPLVLEDGTSLASEDGQDCGMCIKNPAAFVVLQRVFAETESSWLAVEVLNCVQFIVSMHPMNMRFVNQVHTITIFLESYTRLKVEPQQLVLKLLEVMMLQGGIIPHQVRYV